MIHTIENTESEVLNFVTSRLRNFRRIHYGYLVEVVQKKFQTNDVNSLLKNGLIKTNQAKLKRGYLVIPDDASFYN